MRATALIVLAGCGRLDFDPRSDGAIGTAADADAAADGLLLHYTFESDGFLVDRARNHASTCIGACPTPTTGHAGDGAEFTGSSCIEVPQMDLQLTDMTLAVWANASFTATDADLVSIPLNGATTDINSWELYLAGSNNDWTFGGSGTSAGTPALPNTWQHIAITLSGGTMTEYRDGSEMQSFSFAPIYAGDPLLIGCDHDTGVNTYFLHGVLDDIRIYNRGLSPQEIAALAAL